MEKEYKKHALRPPCITWLHGGRSGPRSWPWPTAPTTTVPHVVTRCHMRCHTMRRQTRCERGLTLKRFFHAVYRALRTHLHRMRYLRYPAGTPTQTPTLGMRLSCNFVNVNTIVYHIQCTFTRVHACIHNGQPREDPREEKRACRSSRRTSRR